MKQTTCPMCGYSFDPQANRACDSCPLHRGCNLVCCPACGYNSIDPSQSSIGSWLSRLFKWEEGKEREHSKP